MIAPRAHHCWVDRGIVSETFLPNYSTRRNTDWGGLTDYVEFRTPPFPSPHILTSQCPEENAVTDVAVHTSWRVGFYVEFVQSVTLQARHRVRLNARR